MAADEFFQRKGGIDSPDKSDELGSFLATIGLNCQVSLSHCLKVYRMVPRSTRVEALFRVKPDLLAVAGPAAVGSWISRQLTGSLAKMMGKIKPRVVV